MRRTLDLKWSLTLRVLAVAMACFLVASTLALIGIHGEVRSASAVAADAIVRQLQVQLFRIDANIGLPAQFPDWDTIAGRVQGAGQCVEYLRPDGGVGRSSCIGVDGSAVAGPPAWFSALGAWVLRSRTAVARPISYNGRSFGTLVVTTEPAAVVMRMWSETSGLLRLTAMLVAATCVLQYVAIARALRPTRDILAGLDRLAHGDLSCRLPSFRLVELRRISEVFNALAAALERTTRERGALAARLVEGQEQERLRLARELHDELAQALSAMSALSASIGMTAASEFPALVPETQRLSKIATATMRSLRATLHALRPPEIDDFGLAAGLLALAREQERRASGALTVSIDVEGDLQALPLTAASHVYRIVQEGLTNTVRHADAGQARVTLDCRAEAEPPCRYWLTLTIEDDGCGRDHEGCGLGLTGIRERVMALGGELEMGRSAASGFRLRATIPFDTPAGAR